MLLRFISKLPFNLLPDVVIRLRKNAFNLREKLVAKPLLCHIFDTLLEFLICDDLLSVVQYGHHRVTASEQISEDLV